MTTLQTTQRTVTAQFITDILSLPRWKNVTERVIVYANLVARLQEGTGDEALNKLNLTAELASKALKTDKETEGFYDTVYRCNKAVHQLTDDDGDFIWNDDGELEDKWETDHQVLAQALLEATPAALMPTAEPELLGEYNFHREIHLVKNRSQQDRKDCPNAYAALDVLYSQGYRLNQDIMELTALPMDLNIGKNYAAKQVALANSEAFDNEFFFKYTLDSRGRIYARSLIVQPQGASFDKAVLNFSEAKPLGEHGLQALMIHYANCSGHDKISFIDRMKWARKEGLQKASKFAKCGGDWWAISALIEDTKHAFEEYTAAMEFFRAVNSKNPKAYESSLVCHQDATNSGFQFGAALTGDRQTAEDVNITATCTKTDKPADLYNKMAINLNDVLQDTGLIEVLLSVGVTVNRKLCKKPIMVTGYGAGIKAVLTDIQEENPGISDELLEELKPHVKAALQRTASSMLELTDVLRTAGESLMDDGFDTIEWIAQDGFKCIQQYRDKSAREVKLNKYNVSYTKLEKGEVDPIDTEKMATALPPNFIHSIDAQVLRTAALDAAVEGVAYCPIHDSFGTHAGTFFQLNTILKYAFVKTMCYGWYANFNATNNILNPVDIKQGDYEAEECLRSTYMFS